MPPTGNSEFASNDRASLLATKSNYEWVAEGRHTELGLYFPDTMVASISSKRTTHSAAEQGRRDRLKSAFEDMAEVLFGSNATIDQKNVGEGGRTCDQESNGRKGNLNRIRLINMATERLKDQCKQIEEMKRILDKGHG
ncbi:hypothetical protein IQ07DRAFT_593636 [Pyrenochaeta sp. DS3sAY3a]|nr:hypothetical protein IQ07DRAFT_593636 [Pyrenochaeta sp. DS3sAY3a]